MIVKGSLEAKLAAITDSLGTATNAMMAGNFVLNIIMSASL